MDENMDENMDVEWHRGVFGKFVIPSNLELPCKHRVYNEIGKFTFQAILGSRTVEVEVYEKDNEQGKNTEDSLLLLESHACMRKMLYGRIEQNTFRCLVFENELTSLRVHLATVGMAYVNDNKPANEFREFCKQMISALRYIHENQLRKLIFNSTISISIKLKSNINLTCIFFLMFS